MNVANRVQELRTKLSDANHAYYVLQDPIMSDMDYDRILRELQDLEHQYPYLKSLTSPTENVGGGFSPELSKLPHSTKMLSLDNVYSEEELFEYGNTLRAHGIDPETVEFYIDHKIDGIATSFIYNKKLTCVLSRGDGSVGENLTQNVYDLVNLKCIESLDSDISVSYYSPFIIRGECTIFRSVFTQINNRLIQLGEKPIASPRHMTSALLRTLPKNRKLDLQNVIQFYPYALDNMKPKNPYGVSQHNEMVELFQELHFDLIPGRIVVGLKGILDFYYETQETRCNLPVEIDGVVFRLNSFELQQRLGITNKVPKYALAFKFPAVAGSSIVKDIVIQVGRTGILSPVVEIDPPVVLGGVIVSRATLYNYEFIKQLDIRIGDTISIERAGDVIPKVLSVDLSKRPVDSVPYIFPEICPVCTSPIKLREGQIGYYCTNKECPAVIVGRLVLSVSRDCYNLMNLGISIIKSLVEFNKICHPVDLFTLTYQDFIDVGVGEKRSAAIFSDIQSRKSTITLDKHIFAMGIPGIGLSTAKKLAEKFVSLRVLENVTYEKLIEVPMIGPELAKNIVTFFSNYKPSTVYQEFDLQVEYVNRVVATDNIFSNKKVKVTGKFRIPRSTIHGILERMGAILCSSISTLDYLIVGEDASESKIQSARDKGVAIMESEELYQHI